MNQFEPNEVEALKKMAKERIAFEFSELDALKKVAKERMAYDTLTNKIKTNWIWLVGSGVLTLFLLWDKIHALVLGVK